MRDIINVQAGSTKKISWVSSGNVADSIYAALFTGSETLISSVAMTNSGNGFYWTRITMPDSNAFFVVETKAVVETFPFKKRKFVKTDMMEV